VVIVQLQKAVIAINALRQDLDKTITTELTQGITHLNVVGPEMMREVSDVADGDWISLEV